MSLIDNIFKKDPQKLADKAALQAELKKQHAKERKKWAEKTAKAQLQSKYKAKKETSGKSTLDKLGEFGDRVANMDLVGGGLGGEFGAVPERKKTTTKKTSKSKYVVVGGKAYPVGTIRRKKKAKPKKSFEWDI